MSMWQKTKPDDDIAGPEYCKKCGSTAEPKMRYCPGCTQDMTEKQNHREHLHIICECGYTTYRPCFDAETK